jgi:hypothetical protein
MAPKKDPDSKVFITPAGLEMLCKEIWGEGWRSAFSDWTGISYSQLHRYMTVYNGQRIPKIVVLALVGLRDLGDLGKAPPDVSAFEAEQSASVAVKFQAEKKIKPVRERRDAPLIDMFGDDDPEPPAPPESPPESPPEPAAEPVETTAGKGPARTGPDRKGRTGKAGPAPDRQAKKPAAKAETPAPAKARPRRAALAKA